MQETRIETLLTTNPFQNYMILYHGSYKKLDVINPLSYNNGTKFSKARMSSFWGTDREMCIKFAFMRLIQSGGYLIHFDKDLKYKVKPNEYDQILKYAKDKKLYIYSKKVPKEYIGIGHSPTEGEYTIDLPVKPDAVQELNYSDYRYLLNDISLYPTNDENECKKLLKDAMAYARNNSKLTMRKLVASDNASQKKQRNKYKDILMSVNDIGE